LQQPYQILYDQVNDEDFPIAHNLAIVTDEIQEDLELLYIVNVENAKQCALISFKGNQFQYINKKAVWNKFCFPAFDHQEDIMLHDFHDYSLSLLQSSIQGEFFRFVNTGFGYRIKVEFPSSFVFCFLKEIVSRNQSSSHFLDWLHWRVEIT